MNKNIDEKSLDFELYKQQLREKALTEQFDSHQKQHYHRL